MKRILKAVAVAVLSYAALLPVVHATPVGLELVLLVDASGSVNSTEYALQKQGYIDAFNSTAVQNAILDSKGGAIAVTYVEWSGNSQQTQLVNWSLIDSVADAKDFATAIGATNRAFSGDTAIQASLIFGANLFGNNAYEGSRLVIDVSGDGADNDTTSCNVIVNEACGRDYALSKGVDAVNGLPILGESGLLVYYQDNVKGGKDSFVKPAAGFADFSDAIQDKLIKEINGTPEPGSLALVGLALLGLFGIRRKRLL